MSNGKKTVAIYRRAVLAMGGIAILYLAFVDIGLISLLRPL